MSAIVADLLIEGGSYQPVAFHVKDPETLDPIDLTAGYSASGTVADRADGRGRILLNLTPDMFQLTSDGKLTFAPSSTTTERWARLDDSFYQVELHHASGQSIRVCEGRFRISPQLD